MDDETDNQKVLGDTRPRLGVFKFASCDGCQLQLLSCEDELLRIANQVELAYFIEASSYQGEGPYDVALVEGSITSSDDRKRIESIRQQSKFLVVLGACATAGGIQALRNWQDSSEMLRYVYAQPSFIHTLSTSTAIADHVQVDFELRGCPIDKGQLLEVLRALIAGRRPKTPKHCVCLDCKRQGTVCVAITQKKPCIGPVTQAGCGALCPRFNRGCYGCFGPCRQCNCSNLCEHYQAEGTATAVRLVPILRNFNANASEFRKCGDHIDPATDTGEQL